MPKKVICGVCGRKGIKHKRTKERHGEKAERIYRCSNCGYVVYDLHEDKWVRLVREDGIEY
ncbi:MAG: hypothetical protein ACFFD6_09440 [Candidatus Thorarchaeota archaeon]